MKSLIDLIFPHLCLACQSTNQTRHEPFCVNCLHKLNYCNHLEHKDNEFQQRFYGRMELEHAASYYWYSKGDITQKMIYNIKYNKQKHIAKVLGNLIGKEIIDKKAFTNIDFIVPVPIHPKKKLRRGFNQSEVFSRALSKVVKIPIDSKTLYKKHDTISQTKKSRVDRIKDIMEGFDIHSNNALRGKNILLVDDVLTTGATLESCGLTLQKAGINSLSMLTIAMGRL